MKSKIIEIVGELGGYQLARLLTRKQPKILMYHRFSAVKKGHEITAATFEKQLRLIKRYFNPMTLAELAKIIEQQGSAPANAVVITVDDGYRDFYEVAFPLLKKYQVPATFFVTTGFVNGDIWLWYDQVNWILNNRKTNSENIELAGKFFDFGLSNNQLWKNIVDHFLIIPNSLRISGMTKLIEVCGVQVPSEVPMEYSSVSWQQLREMQEHGVEIGGHTVTHPSLGHSDLETSSKEINNSLETLNLVLGNKPRTFCYPNGQPEDYSSDIKELVRVSGYTAAVTAFSDCHNVEFPYSWRRFTATEERFQFMKSLFGVEHIGNIVRKFNRSNI